MNAAVAFLSTVVSLLAIEIVLWAFGFEGLPRETRLLWDHYTPQPGCNVDCKIRQFNRIATYDPDIGFVGPWLEGASFRDGPSHFKVLVIGDSISQSDWKGPSYVDFLREHIQQSRPTAEVLNAGVGGYDTELEYRYLKKHGERLKPNLILLQFCMNDFSATPVVVKQPNGSWTAYNMGDYAPHVSSFLMSHSRIYRLAFFALVRHVAETTPAIGERKVRQALARVLAESRRLGAELRIVVFPYFLATDPADNGGRIRRILKELRLDDRTIDLGDAFATDRIASYRLNPADYTHPNREGDLLAARWIGEAIAPILETQPNATRPAK